MALILKRFGPLLGTAALGALTPIVPVVQEWVAAHPSAAIAASFLAQIVYLFFPQPHK